MKVIVVLVNFAQPAIKCVLVVLGDRLVYLGLVAIGRFETLRNVLSVPAVVLSINLIFLAPPLRVDDRIQARRASSLRHHFVVWIIDLKSLLRTIPWNANMCCIFRAFTPP